jgi:hypothetical protein
MLVDKRREEALKSLCTTLGNSCSDKETGAMAKVIDNYRHTNTIAVIPSDKTCVEFYRIGTGSTIIIMNKPS